MDKIDPLEIHRRINFLLLRTKSTKYKTKLREIRSAWHVSRYDNDPEKSIEQVTRDFLKMEFLIKMDEG